MTFRTVIIGGDAAGMSAATRVRELRPDAEVVVLEKSRFTSYSACGIPFLVGGLVAGGVEALVARTPEEHRERGIDVRTHHEATGDRHRRRRGRVRSTSTPARIDRIGYDELLVATGGEPIRPDLPGIDLPFVHGVQILDDAQALLSLADEGCRRIVVVGGGYIGLEMAEAYIERGCTATVIERAAAAAAASSTPTSAPASPTPCAPTASTSAAASTVEGFEPGAVLTSDGRVAGRPRRSSASACAALRAGRRRGHRARRARTPSVVDERQATTSAARDLVGRRLRRRRRTS